MEKMTRCQYLKKKNLKCHRLILIIHLKLELQKVIHIIITTFI